MTKVRVIRFPVDFQVFDFRLFNYKPITDYLVNLQKASVYETGRLPITDY